MYCHIPLEDLLYNNQCCIARVGGGAVGAKLFCGAGATKVDVDKGSMLERYRDSQKLLGG